MADHTAGVKRGHELDDDFYSHPHKKQVNKMVNPFPHYANGPVFHPAQQIDLRQAQSGNGRCIGPLSLNIQHTSHILKNDIGMTET